MATSTESPATPSADDTVRDDPESVAPPTDDLSADERALLVDNLRFVLDGPWRSTRDMVRSNSDRADLLPDPSRTLDEART